MSTIYTARTDTAWGVFNADGLISEHRTRAEARAAKQAAATPEPETAPVEDVTVEEHYDFTDTLAPAWAELAEAVLDGRPVTVSSKTLPQQGRRVVIAGPHADVVDAMNLLLIRQTEALAALKAWATENRAQLRPLSQSRRRTANREFVTRYGRGLAD